jgi:uncharacterized membrane protein
LHRCSFHRASSFARDRITQWTLGIFLGTFLYCMLALPAAHALPRPFAPVVTVIGAIILAIVCVGLLLFFIHHISTAISVNHIVDRIASETEAAIDEVMPRPRRQVHLETSDAAEPVSWKTPLVSNESGYIRFVDLKQLLALATSRHVKVRMVRRIGQYVPAGTPLLMVNKAERLSAEAAAAFRAAFDFGPTRTLQQDIEFGVLQIVDIALKAISPAVNDPTTAIGCVDQLSRILYKFPVVGDARPGLQIKVDTHVYTAMSKVPVKSAAIAVCVHLPLQIAEVIAELLRSNGGVFPAFPSKRLTGNVGGRSQRGFAHIPHFSRLRFIRE